MTNAIPGDDPFQQVQQVRTETRASPVLNLSEAEDGRIHSYHAMVKPVGAACNLDCSYCYYRHKEQLLGQPGSPRMSADVLDEHIRQYIQAQNSPEVIFSWQGGEPTVAGIEFFREVVAIQKRYRKFNQRIENDLQTNGILLDEEWAVFLKQNDFLVGLSIDGPRELHDVCRISKGGKPTFDKVMAAAGLLREHAIPFNALCVVNQSNVKRPRDVYRFLTREVRPRMVQFIPCVEFAQFMDVAPGKWDTAALPVVGSPRSKPGHANAVVTDWSVAPEDWGRFLCSVWNDWFARDYGKAFVDVFEDAVSHAAGGGAQRCVTAESCGRGVAIEHNGDVFSCDHFVYTEYKLGNILNEHQGNMVFTEQQKQFGLAKHATLPDCCRNCDYLTLCQGDCPKNRFVKTLDGKAGLSYLCPGLKKFFAHVQPDMREILRRISQTQGRQFR